jgi:hypothetical protein
MDRILLFLMLVLQSIKVSYAPAILYPLCCLGAQRIAALMPAHLIDLSHTRKIGVRDS